MPNLPSWIDERKSAMKMSQKQEKDWAKKTGGQRRPGSGNKTRAPQDNRTKKYLDQLKATKSSSISIGLSEWKKLQRDALIEGREPRMVIYFAREGISLQITEA